LVSMPIEIDRDPDLNRQTDRQPMVAYVSIYSSSAARPYFFLSYNVRECKGVKHMHVTPAPSRYSMWSLAGTILEFIYCD
jgi:hypothetical protein